MEEYYYFNIINKQYLFPKSFKKYELFSTFYQPYTFKGFLVWKLWQNFEFIRRLSIVQFPEKIVPFNQIIKHIETPAILAFNRGSKGEEQKITVLGINPISKKEFFIKYAESNIARNNVNNEGAILEQLKHLNFVPKLQQHINELNYTFILTNVLKGVRLKKQPLDQKLLSVLLIISEQNIKSERIYNLGTDTCFGHGDFCPWNMMVNNDTIQVYDWEMAGSYPIGYDLFTFIFQTSFLLTPKKKITEIIEKESDLIKNYFLAKGIHDWGKFLKDFVSIKLILETNKNNQRLILHYQKLKTYAEKI